MARCYHRACGRTFGGVGGFDRHIRLLSEPPWVVCLDPKAVGLNEVDGIWVRQAGKVITPENGEVVLEATPVGR